MQSVGLHSLLSGSHVEPETFHAGRGVPRGAPAFLAGDFAGPGICPRASKAEDFSSGILKLASRDDRRSSSDLILWFVTGVHNLYPSIYVPRSQK